MSWTYSDLAALQKRKHKFAFNPSNEAEKSNISPMRTNLTNTGMAAQKIFEMTAAAYERKGLLRLRKTDPPVKFIGGKPIFQINPWLDYAGTWAERGGRMLCLEVKSTVKTRLDLSLGQLESVTSWIEFGATVAVIWYRFDLCRIAYPGELCDNPKWDELQEVKPGIGGVVFDWLENLRGRKV